MTDAALKPHISWSRRSQTSTLKSERLKTTSAKSAASNAGSRKNSRRRSGLPKSPCRPPKPKGLKPFSKPCVRERTAAPQAFRPRAVPLFLKNGFTADLCAEEASASTCSSEHEDGIPAAAVIEPEPELTADQKRSLLLSLFLGRKDVFAVRVLNFDDEGHVAKTACMHVWQRFGKDVVVDHLCGRAVLGVYPR